jgi:hypothetical protein
MRIFILLVVGACAVYGQSIAGRRPLFELDNSAKRKLVEKVLTLKRGDSYQTITNALGTPCFNSMTNAEAYKAVGGFLRYDALVVSSYTQLDRAFDELTYIWLDSSNRLTRIEMCITLR